MYNNAYMFHIIILIDRIFNKEGEIMKLTKKQQELVLQHQSLIWKIVHEVYQNVTDDRIEARDLFQEGIMIMIEKLKNYDESQGTFVNFIYPQVKRDLWEYIKRNTKEIPFEYIPNTSGSLESTKSDSKIFIDRLCNSILSRQQRKFFNEYYINDKTQNQIAKKFSVSQQAVSKAMTNINKKVRLYYSDHNCII